MSYLSATTTFVKQSFWVRGLSLSDWLLDMLMLYHPWVLKFWSFEFSLSLSQTWPTSWDNKFLAASHNVTNNKPREKPEEWGPCHFASHTTATETEPKTGSFCTKPSKWKKWRTSTDDERYQLQPNEANSIHSDAGFRRESLCVPPVNTERGQIESLWKRNYGRPVLSSARNVVSVSLSKTICRLKSTELNNKSQHWRNPRWNTRVKFSLLTSRARSGAVWKSRWSSWASRPK